MKLSTALIGGLAGATALTLVHEIVRRKDPDAPRMDLLGMNALAKLLTKANVKIPDENTLFNTTMAGDILSNALYYSLAGVGTKKQAPFIGAVLGVAAGAGAVLLPEPMGLNDEPSNRTNKTKALTVAYYSFGGIVASAVMSLLEKKKFVNSHVL